MYRAAVNAGVREQNTSIRREYGNWRERRLLNSAGEVDGAVQGPPTLSQPPQAGRAEVPPALEAVETLGRGQ